MIRDGQLDIYHLGFLDQEDKLDWLNDRQGLIEAKETTKGLRKTIFSINR